MAENNGIPADQLQCPTCKTPFSFPVEVACEREWWPTDMPDGSTVASTLEDSPLYITCPTGHRWSVDRWWRRDETPSLFRLGRYLAVAE